MRALRLSVPGTVVLALLGGLGGFAVAGDDEALAPDMPHEVSGTLRFDGEFLGSTVSVEDGRTLVRGHGPHEMIELDDPRLSGTVRTVLNRDYIGDRQYGSDGEVGAGAIELVSDDGSWVGTMRGYVSMDPRTHHWHCELTGTGAHDGFPALLYDTRPETGVWDSSPPVGRLSGGSGHGNERPGERATRPGG
jgi:hypothetical protein